MWPSGTRRRCSETGSLAERLTLAEAERDFWMAAAALQARKASTAMASVRRFLAARRARKAETNGGIEALQGAGPTIGGEGA